ncbi:hypothetical protein HFP15_41770 [Amycolatopsis sp. K13G38]|uniref:Uncharacterized protein n=1 Tax=Amycolatopsis acididurans TaxID=2724524 RepID=A0ABX1JJJ5_9PSEU|nr:hypothetical protein [Amycolatopsis acididurans]NKQ59381.1 hypothetical protein [Amycolatopsis acididurans]
MEEVLAEARGDRAAARPLLTMLTFGCRSLPRFEDEHACLLGRTTTQQHPASVNWTDHGDITRALRAMARLMDEFDDQAVEPVRKALRRDSCRIDEPTEGWPGGTPLARFATRFYKATSSAIFLAMSSSESSSVLRPLREPRSGLIARISS